MKKREGGRKRGKREKKERTPLSCESVFSTMCVPISKNTLAPALTRRGAREYTFGTFFQIN